MKRLGPCWSWRKALTLGEAWRTKRGCVVVRYEDGPLVELDEGRIAPVYKQGKPVPVTDARLLLQAVGAQRYELGALGTSRDHLGRCVYAGGLLPGGILSPALVVTADGDRVGLLTRTSGAIVERDADTVCAAWPKATALTAWLWTETKFWNE